MPELLPNVRLQLANTAENVVLVRETLTGVAQAVDIDGSDLNDIRTAVTEACNNVVLHAYEGRPGPMEVEVYMAPATLGILVRDHGTGIRARTGDADPSSAGIGIGLHVIRTLAHSVEIEQAVHGGTSVHMEFSLPSLSVLEPCSNESELPTPALAQAPSTTKLSIAPFGLARTVLPRFVSALAARAHFSTDRISDAQLLADALVAHTRSAMSGETLSMSVDVEPRKLELCIAPLAAGRAQQLLGDSELDGLGRVIEKLTDRRHVTAIGPYETLTLSLIDGR